MFLDEIKYQALEILLQKQNLEIQALRNDIATSQNQYIPAFCTLDQACKLKGGSEAKNLHKRKWQQPCCGTRYTRCNGVRVWPRAEILRWLQVTDENLEDYAKEMGVNISRYFKNGKAV